jgi:hypothetical protein
MISGEFVVVATVMGSKFTTSGALIRMASRPLPIQDTAMYPYHHRLTWLRVSTMMLNASSRYVA